MKQTEVIRFKVYLAKDKKDWYKVFIFLNREQMRIFEKEQSKLLKFKPAGKFEALCRRWQVYTKAERKKWGMGNILFYNGGYGAGTVAHEMSHAVTYTFLYQKYKVNFNKLLRDKKLEESFAWMQGYLVSQFWKNHYKHFKS